MAQLVRSAMAIVLDLVWLLLSGIIVWTILGGGGQYTLAGYAVRIRSVSNPLLAWQVIAVLRLLPLGAVPFLAVTRWRLDHGASCCLSWCNEVSALLSSVTPAKARRALVIFLATITVVKLANAALYPGFFSGDDVEIHEMTFASLFAWKWDAWNLRNAFYPMTFIYPLQALLVSAGTTDTAPLVFAGRAVVAVLSSITIWLVYRTGVNLDSRGVGLVAALMFGVHRLHVTFGGSELPRPVASVFIVAAFLCLLTQRQSLVRAACAGALLAVGGALRFGEPVFIVPAIVTTLVSHTRAATVVLAASFVVVATLVLGLADLWYWGSSFYSVQNIVQYTLIDRLSSRGYEHPFFYVTMLTSWTSIAVALLAIFGARSSWQVTMWWLLPLIVLSALPHKEPRYVIALLPFVCLSASLGLHRLLRAMQSDAVVWRPSTVAVLTIVLCAGGVLLEVGGWRFRKSSAPIELAHVISQRGCAGGVAVEQLWAVGGRLYLRDCGAVIDLDRAALQQANAEWVLLRRPVRPDERAILESVGAREVTLPDADASYVVLRRTP